MSGIVSLTRKQSGIEKETGTGNESGTENENESESGGHDWLFS
jgi:hypothetical protein